MNMAETLYTLDILRLASQLEYNPTFSESLEGYVLGHAEMKSKICGSIATVKVAMRGDVILEALIDIKSCAMGQASTALLIEYMQGKRYSEIMDMRALLQSRLEGNDNDVSAFPKLEILDTAIGYHARHGAILLPYDALLKAMESKVL